MQRGPLLEALAGGDAPLAEAQAALFAARDAWREDARCAQLFATLADYGAGGEDDPLGDAAIARGLVMAFVDHIAPVLAQHPLGQVPLRHGNRGGVRSLLIAHRGRAFLTLVIREPGDSTYRAAAFGNGSMRDVVLAGGGGGRIVRRAGECLEMEQVRFTPDHSFALDLACETLQVETIARRLVTLQLIRLPEHPEPIREYSLETGELLHQSAGHPDDSRHELALALLGRMGRADAAPLMVEMTSDGGGASDHLRWQALRECLALDSATGLAALREMATSIADPLCGPAQALLAQLRIAYPEIAMLEAA